MKKANSNNKYINQTHAFVFAALGDKTRLLLVARLSRESPLSISALKEDFGLTRQGIAKHLQVLKKAGIVYSTHKGRQTLFAFNPQPLDNINQYLKHISEDWNQALLRLKSFVEED